MTVQAFIADLIEHAPELRALYGEHVRDYDECLPHVFMGDVARFAIVRASRAEVLKPLMSSLERAVELGDSQVRELIAVSFVENLFGEDQALGHIRPLLGPRLRSEVDTIFREAGLA